MKKQYLILVCIVLLAAAAAGYKLYLHKVDGIIATGTVEVTLADIVPRINGYITELTIQSGDPVTAGQVIARLKRPDLAAQLAADEAALAKARVQLTDLEKGARQQEYQQAAATVASARAVLDKAHNDLVRTRALFQQGAVSSQQLDAAQASFDVADNSLRAAESQQSLTAAGSRPDVIKAQQLEVQRLEAAVIAAQAALADTIITSPLTGTVLSKNFETGEYASPGSALATVGNLNDCWVKVYISSAQLGLIKLGQAVTVHVDAYPQRPFVGTIKEISQTAEFTPRQSITKEERANLVFYVKVKIDNPEGILKPGMPADVVIP